MEKDKKTLLSIVTILLFFAGIFGSLGILNSHEKSDAQRFKEEYESYNDQVVQNQTYPNVSISLDNPIHYQSDDDIVRFMEHGTGIIYFGFPTCPWCRTLVPILLSASESTNFHDVYYVNVADIRDTRILDDNGEVVVTKEGTNGYHAILEKLDSYLKDYLLTDENGKSVNTGEKRLYAPTVVGIQEGRIVGVHEGTIDSQKSGFQKLTSKEEEELFGILQDLFLKVSDSTCDDAC